MKAHIPFKRFAFFNCVNLHPYTEASLTIDGIFYVVDPGFAKSKVFNPKVGRAPQLALIGH